MKIIHCADLHLDSQMTANLTKSRQESAKRNHPYVYTDGRICRKDRGASDHDIGRSV